MDTPKRVMLSWSTGKDCAWALYILRQDPAVEVVGLLTAFNEETDRVAVHSVRRELVQAQAAAANLPLTSVPLPWPCPNKVYEERTRAALSESAAAGVTHIAYGDVFLTDIRAYRERLLAGTGLDPLFPVWCDPTKTPERAAEMLAAGVEAVLTCVDTNLLSAVYCGRTWGAEFVSDLPPQIDPCGERGEFHTFCTAGPMFTAPVRVTIAPTEVRGEFAFADLTAG